jgi:hypothetical protein
MMMMVVVSSIPRDVIGPIVHRCWGLSKVRCGGEGRYLHGWWKVLESARYLFLGVNPQDNMCHHVSGMEQSAE